MSVGKIFIHANHVGSYRYDTLYDVNGTVPQVNWKVSTFSNIKIHIVIFLPRHSMQTVCDSHEISIFIFSENIKM